jgi:hypothetical protein
MSKPTALRLPHNCPMNALRVQSAKPRLQRASTKLDTRIIATGSVVERAPCFAAATAKRAPNPAKNVDVEAMVSATLDHTLMDGTASYTRHPITPIRPNAGTTTPMYALSIASIS